MVQDRTEKKQYTFSIKNCIPLSLSKGESTVLVLRDLSAAFDTIDHGNLLRVCHPGLEYVDF